MKLNSISHIYAPTGFRRDCDKFSISSQFILILDFHPWGCIFLESRKVQESTAPIAILRFDCRDKPLTTTISEKSFTERGQGKQELIGHEEGCCTLQVFKGLFFPLFGLRGGGF